MNLVFIKLYGCIIFIFPLFLTVEYASVLTEDKNIASYPEITNSAIENLKFASRGGVSVLEVVVAVVAAVIVVVVVAEAVAAEQDMAVLEAI